MTTNTVDIDMRREFTPWLLLILFFTPFLLSLLVGRTAVSLACLAIPAAFYLAANPRHSLFVFLVSVSIYFPYHFSGFALHPFDLAMGILFFSVVLDFLINTRTEIRPTGFDLPFMLLIATTILSTVFAFRVRESIIPTLRIIVIYLAFRAVFKLSLEISVRKIVLFYIYHVFILSLINSAIFISIGGSARVFGPAWLAFEIYTITALPMALSFFIWADTFNERVRYAVISLTIVFALFALQSRGALLGAVITLPFLIYFAYKKTRFPRLTGYRQNLKKIIVITSLGIVLLIAFNHTLLLGFIDRVQEMIASIVSPKGTIALRLVLWKAAFEGFLSSPLVGIGIGNYINVEQIVPMIKTEPVWYYIRGMTAHNVVMQYLCETGLLGTSALLLVTYTILKKAYRSFKADLSHADMQVSMALFMTAITFAHSIFYMRAWTWGQEGYLMAVIFGLNAAWFYELKNRGKVN